MSGVGAARAAKTWRSIAEVKRANRDVKHYWFTPASMSFFGTRIVTDIVAGRYFVTSEPLPRSTELRYTVREVLEDGVVLTVGTLYDHPDLDAALAALHAHAKETG